MRLWRLLAVAPVLAGVMLFGASPAYAHVKLVSTNPVDGAQLRAPVAKVTLRFSEPINPDLAKAAVTVDGKQARSASKVRGSTVTVTTPERGGQFQVAFRVVSRDGHAVSDKIEFVVRARAGGLAGPRQSGEAGAAPQRSPTAEEATPSGPAAVVNGPATTDAKGRTVTRSWIWILVGLGGVGLLGALAYVLVAGRSRPSESEASSVDTVDEPGSRDG